MKTPILVAGGVLALAVSVWWLKHSPAEKAVETPVSTHQSLASKNADLAADRTSSAKNLQPSRNTSDVISAASDAQTPAFARYGTEQAAPPTSRSTPSKRNPSPSSAPTAASYASSHGIWQSAPISASRSPMQPSTSTSSSGGMRAAIPNSSVASAATAASPSGISAAAPLSNGNSAAANPDAGAIELDPGVPVPAALLTPGEKQSPTVAAAQQQLADSFVENVNAALSQPATANNDAAASQAYFDSLTLANEQYRALYGDAAYNQKTMQATLESQGGK